MPCWHNLTLQNAPGLLSRRSMAPRVRLSLNNNSHQRKGRRRDGLQIPAEHRHRRSKPTLGHIRAHWRHAATTTSVSAPVDGSFASVDTPQRTASAATRQLVRRRQFEASIGQLTSRPSQLGAVGVRLALAGGVVRGVAAEAAERVEACAARQGGASSKHGKSDRSQKAERRCLLPWPPAAADVAAAQWNASIERERASFDRRIGAHRWRCSRGRCTCPWRRRRRPGRSSTGGARRPGPRSQGRTRWWASRCTW